VFGGKILEDVLSQVLVVDLYTKIEAMAMTLKFINLTFSFLNTGSRYQYGMH
jgi:hypothetical protein